MALSRTTFEMRSGFSSTVLYVSAEPIELGDDEHVPGFEFIHQSRETPALRNGDAARDGLGDYTAWS